MARSTTRISKLPIPYNYHYARQKRRAKKRGHPFNLSPPIFLHLILQPCAYCGSPPSKKWGDGKHPLMANGLDRVNTKGGYTKGNVVPCCTQCNFMKHTSSLDTFFNQVRKIAKKFLAYSSVNQLKAGINWRVYGSHKKTKKVVKGNSKARNSGA